MFSTAVAPPSVSLFSSTGSGPLKLWSIKTDSAHLESCVHLVQDNTSRLPQTGTSLVSLPPLVELGGAERKPENDPEDLGYALDQTVLHIQSPNLPTTYISCPPDRSLALGLKHPWIHLQVRNMGRPWSFEVGLVDNMGRTGVLRLSTFQTRPTLKLYRNQPRTYPLLHLPLSFPSRSSRPLTAWTKIDLHLPIFIPYFSYSSLLTSDGQGDSDNTSPQPRAATDTTVPSGSYSHVSFVRVYANCRLRRIWLDENGPSQVIPWEFELYSAD